MSRLRPREASMQLGAVPRVSFCLPCWWAVCPVPLLISLHDPAWAGLAGHVPAFPACPFVWPGLLVICFRLPGLAGHMPALPAYPLPVPRSSQGRVCIAPAGVVFHATTSILRRGLSTASFRGYCVCPPVGNGGRAKRGPRTLAYRRMYIYTQNVYIDRERGRA